MDMVRSDITTIYASQFPTLSHIHSWRRNYPQQFPRDESPDAPGLTKYL